MAYEYRDRTYTVPARTEVAHLVIARICDGCGTRQDANEEDRSFDDTSWMPFAVECGDGWADEGFVRVEKLFCGPCTEGLADRLIQLGFGSHQHAGRSWLEDVSCPGFTEPDECPTPESPAEEDDFDLVEALKILP